MSYRSAIPRRSPYALASRGICRELSSRPGDSGRYTGYFALNRTRMSLFRIQLWWLCLGCLMYRPNFSRQYYSLIYLSVARRHPEKRSDALHYNKSSRTFYYISLFFSAMQDCWQIECMHTGICIISRQRALKWTRFIKYRGRLFLSVAVVGIFQAPADTIRQAPPLTSQFAHKHVIYF